MHTFTDFLARVFQAWIKLALLALSGLMLLGLLVIGVVAVVLTVVWSLLTGRKPAIVTTFMRFRQASQQFRQGPWQGPRTPASAQNAEVVDVQVREVRNDLGGPERP